MKVKLQTTRARIDRIDREIIALLAQRMESVAEIARQKQTDESRPLRDEGREREVLGAWTTEARRLGISAYYAGRILREVLNYSRRVQEMSLDRRADETGPAALRVGFQGVSGSYSDLTIGKLFALREGSPVERRGFRSFASVVDALEARELDYGLLPIENTIAGSINEVYQLLASRPVTIVGEELWRVEHCLVGVAGTRLEQVRTIRSHPVALQQCQHFLGALGDCTSESHFDTAAAAESIAQEGRTDLAAICSAESAERLGLTIIRRDIADQDDNYTRFVLVSREPEKVSAGRRCKTSLVITVNHRRGALAECLQAFARRSINLTKLESRPRPESPWEYLFYLDIDGHQDAGTVKAALKEIREYTNHFKVLGSYPCCGNERDIRAVSDQPEALAPVITSPEPRAQVAERTLVQVGQAAVGQGHFTLILGPCAVESRKQMMAAAAMAKEAGAAILRGGAFKPRSSPHSFQGLGFPGLELLREAARAYELPCVTEVLRPEDVDRIAEKADMLQVGARNMQNYALLKKLGTTSKPILLKRGLSATLDELLAAAEYITAGGNQRVILCERGIRTFETATRTTLDVSAVPVLKERSNLPVIVDPSHAAGRRELVIPLALAAAACGADGLMIELHPAPAEALCDREQALTADDLRDLIERLRPIIASQGRRI